MTNCIFYATPRGWLAYGSALLAGALLPLGFAPFNLFPLAILSPALLFWLWRNVSPWAAFRRGWVYGLGMFGVGVSWLYVSFHHFAYMHPLVAGGLTTLFVMGMALYPALLGYVVVRAFPSCNRVRLLLAIPALWVLLEWLRGWFLTGFPWLLLGYSQIDTPLAGFAPVFGVYGVSWAATFSASLLVYAGLAGKQAALRHALPVFILLWGAGGLLTLVNWALPKGKPIQVALVQGNIAQTIKWEPGYAENTLETYLRLSRGREGLDLIVWPETAIPLFRHEVDLFLAELDSERLFSHADFLTGIPVYDAEEDKYYNSVISLSQTPGVYHKRHLVPFGEYVPFRGLFGNVLDLLNAPMSDFSPGAEIQAPIWAAGQVLGVSICYEDAFPSEVRRALPDANMLVNVSNDGWFGDSIAPHQHLQIARMRALENGQYMLRATNTGISAIIDHKGRIVARARQFQEDVVIASAQPFESGAPYALSGNGPLFLIMLASLVAGILLHYYWHPSPRP